MRARSDYSQASQVDWNDIDKSVTADTTPIYRENFYDTLLVRRRSRLCNERFWLIEDLAVFQGEHDVTARWILRPEQIEVEDGIAIETAEGVRLTLIPLVGSGRFDSRTIDGFPDRLDGKSVQIDFAARGSAVRWLWLAFPQQARRVVEEVTADWAAVPENGHRFEYSSAQAALDTTKYRLPFTMPPHELGDYPLRAQVVVPANRQRPRLRQMVASPPRGHARGQIVR